MTVQSYSVVGQHSLDGTGSPVYAKQGLSAVSGATLHFFVQSLSTAFSRPHSSRGYFSIAFQLAASAGHIARL